MSARSPNRSPPDVDGRDKLVEVQDLTKHFAVKQGVFAAGKGIVHAVEDVSLTVRRGETLGIVGESGCGKSTTARLMVRLIDPTARHDPLRRPRHHDLSPRQLRPLRRADADHLPGPVLVAEPAEERRPDHRRAVRDPRHREGRARRVQELLDRVGLSPEHYNRYPHEFSGGQRQRIGVARALALQPGLIVCDEPVSALDVSIQAQILNLLKDLQQDFDLTYLFISHDLSVSGISPTASRSCTSAGSSSRARPTSSTSTRGIRTRRRCSRPCRGTGPNGGLGGRQRIILTGDVPSPVIPPPGLRVPPSLPALPPGTLRRRTPLLRSLRGRARGGVPLSGRALADHPDELRHPFGAMREVCARDDG